MRLRVWELVDHIDKAGFPGAGLVALKAFVDTLPADPERHGELDIVRMRDSEVRLVDEFLDRVLTKVFKGERGTKISGGTIRNWTEQRRLPVTSNLHALFDLFDYDAAALFEPRAPAPPKPEAAAVQGLRESLQRELVRFNRAGASRAPVKRGRPPGKKSRK
jgi:hypothetical protein